MFEMGRRGVGKECEKSSWPSLIFFSCFYFGDL